MNYNKISLIILFILFPVLISCNEGINDPVPDGNYKYVAYDSLGAIISKGWLKIEAKDSSTIFGNWEINKVGNPQNIGPQIGKGELEGGFNDSILVVELNPNYVDNNVGLVGNPEKNKYTGKWYYSSFIGLTNWGRFEAVKD